MNRKSFAFVFSLLILANGVLLLLVPEVFLGPFGVSTDAAGWMLARFWGAFALAAGMILWQARRGTTAAWQSAWLNLFVYFAAASVLNIWSTTSGIFNAAGWVIVIADLALVAVCGYLLFSSKATA